MTVERGATAEYRAHVHAALADPARVRIVDTLLLGDAAPIELQSLLAMPSNLVAHHLKVLEREGLVVRTRSEADRRRAYVQLVPATLDSLTPVPVAAVPRVVFVCTANSARSQMAATLWRRSSSVPAVSAGTRPAPAVHPGAVAAALRHGTPLLDASPCSLQDVLRAEDLLITVCDNAHEQLAAETRVSALHWSVRDPVRIGTDSAFDAAYTELTHRISQLAPRLHAS